MNQQRHIIQKLNVDVEAGDLALARRLYANMPAFINDVLVPAIEAELDKLGLDEDEFWQADSLLLDIPVADEAMLEQEAPALAAHALRRLLFEKPKTAAPADDWADLRQMVAAQMPGNKHAAQEQPAVEEALPQQATEQAALPAATPPAQSSTKQTLLQDAQLLPVQDEPLPPVHDEQAGQLAGYTMPGTVNAAMHGNQQAGVADETNSQPLQPGSQQKNIAANAAPPAAGDKTGVPAGQAQAEAIQQQRLVGKLQSVWVHFLQTGVLPWHAGAGPGMLNEEGLAQLVLTHTQWVQKSLAAVLRGSPGAMRRLVLQYSPPFVLQVVQIMAGIQPGYTQQLREVWAKTPENHPQQMQQAMLFAILQQAVAIPALPAQQWPPFIEMLADVLPRAVHLSTVKLDDVQENPAQPAAGNLPPAVEATTPATPVEQEADGMANTIAGLLRKNPFLQPPGKQATRKPVTAAVDTDGTYVVNGGLVILHPFIEYFFRECGLLSGSFFKNNAAAETAVHLLYYLATGQEQPFECDMRFERYLCNIPDDEPVNRFIELTEQMKTECDQLLTAAVGHWKALKNTSPGGLRQGFLQREAKLVRHAGDHKLLVAPETIDILMQQLPWGVSIVRLPWMPEILHVEWHNA